MRLRACLHLVPALLFAQSPTPNPPVPLAQWEAFVKAHPGHLEGRSGHIQALYREAVRRAKAPSQAAPDVRDREVWGAVAAALDRAFRDGSWVRMGSVGLPHYWPAKQPAPEGQSALMKDLYRRHLPKVEALLQSQATDHGFAPWDLWCRMADVSERSDRPGFLAGIAPYPGINRGVWPNIHTLELVTNAAVRAQDWKALRASLLPRAEDDLDALVDLVELATETLPPGAAPSASDGEHFASRTWEMGLGALFQALVRLDRLSEAEGLVLRMAASKASAGLVEKSRAMAAALGRGDWAERWKGVHFQPDPKREGQSRLERKLAWLVSGGPQWLLLEGGQPEWGQAFQRVAGQEPLLVLDLPVLTWPDGELAQALREREGWPAGPHWVLLDRRGKVTAHGNGLPRTEDVAAAASKVQDETVISQLRRYCAEHPGRIDARQALADRLKALGERRTRALLGMPEPQPQPRLMIMGPMEIEVLKRYQMPLERKALSPDQDQALWGEVADLLSEAPFHCELPDLAVHSPRMQAVARRQKGTLEARLKEQPSDLRIWSAWLQASRVLGSLDLTPLLGELVQAPGVKEPLPPVIVRIAWFTDCRSREDWPRLLEAGRPVLDRLLDPAYEGEGLDEFTCTSLLVPLAEAHLRTGRPGEAVRLVDAWIAAKGWPGAQETVAKLAERLAREAQGPGRS